MDRIDNILLLVTPLDRGGGAYAPQNILLEHQQENQMGKNIIQMLPVVPPPALHNHENISLEHNFRNSLRRGSNPGGRKN